MPKFRVKFCLEYLKIPNTIPTLSKTSPSPTPFASPSKTTPRTCVETPQQVFLKEKLRKNVKSHTRLGTLVNLGDFIPFYVDTGLVSEVPWETSWVCRGLVRVA